MTIDTLPPISVVRYIADVFHRHLFHGGNLCSSQNLKYFLYFDAAEHDDRSENSGKQQLHRTKGTRRVSFKPSGAGQGGRQFNNKPQKNLNLAIRATLDDDDDMVDFPNGLNREGNVSDSIVFATRLVGENYDFSVLVSQK